MYLIVQIISESFCKTGINAKYLGEPGIKKDVRRNTAIFVTSL